VAREDKAPSATPVEIVRIIEQGLGPSGFSVFGESSRAPATLLGQERPAKQFSMRSGNPLFASQMIEHALEVGLYAPLRLVVYG